MTKPDKNSIDDLLGRHEGPLGEAKSVRFPKELDDFLEEIAKESTRHTTTDIIREAVRRLRNDYLLMKKGNKR